MPFVICTIAVFLCVGVYVYFIFSLVTEDQVTAQFLRADHSVKMAIRTFHVQFKLGQCTEANTLPKNKRFDEQFVRLFSVFVHLLCACVKPVYLLQNGGIFLYYINLLSSEIFFPK